MKIPRTLLPTMLWIGLGCALTAQTRWSIQDDGGIAWNVTRGEAHRDHVEMSGQKVSVIVTYSVDKAGLFTINRHVVFPMLRFRPNQTRDHLALDFSEDASPRISLNNESSRILTKPRVR